MKKADNDPKRLWQHPEMQRLDAHPEAQRLTGHPQPESLPAHEEATPMTAPITGKVPATSDAQETAGFARGAGWVALIVLGLMVVAAFLWPTRVTQSDTILSSADANGLYSPTSAAVIAAVPTNVVISDTVVQLTSTVATSSANSIPSSANGTQPSAVVVYLFNTDSSVIPETANLTAVARKAHDSGKTVVIKAYTDETGRAAYNQRLSERRAKAVGNYMVAHGVPAKHIKAKGYGPTHAYANNAQDRRAEITLE